jgi:hypothetical protein
MPIPRADWIKDTQWSEKHLTPTGWVYGTNRTERGRFEAEIPPPPDCLLTIRSLSCIPSDWSQKPRDWSEIRWATRDMVRLRQAIERYGWGYTTAISAESFAQHRNIPNIELLALPPHERPRGRRPRRYGNAMTF